MSKAAAAEPSIRYRTSVIALICAAAPPLLAIHELKSLGWALVAASTVMLLPIISSRFTRHMSVLIGMLVLLGLIPINTDVSWGHLAGMGAALIATIAVPYLVTTRIYKEQVIRFPFRMHRKWHKREFGYLAFTAIASYLILPFYLHNTGSYLNWDVPLDPSHIIRLFIGTNGLGIWDELFFIGVCLALLRQHLPFMWANIAQGLLWTTFLYELGFRGWGSLLIFIFALTQGVMFKNSKSLAYIITVHLTLDFVLFLVLLHLHHPHLLRIFITSPL